MLSTDGRTENLDSGLVLLFGSGPLAFDHEAGVRVHRVGGPTELAWTQSTFPVYGALSVFDRDADAGTLMSGGRPADYRCVTGERIVHRIGYDLFAEIGFLLTHGQPASNALIPTLELHIALLRHLAGRVGRCLRWRFLPVRTDTTSSAA